MKFVAPFLKDGPGATAVEYGLVAALVALAIISAARVLGTQIEPASTVVSEMPNGGGSTP